MMFSHFLRQENKVSSMRSTPLIYEGAKTSQIEDTFPAPKLVAPKLFLGVQAFGHI